MKYLGEVKLITNDQDDHNFTSFFFIFFIPVIWGCISSLFASNWFVCSGNWAFLVSLYLMWKMGSPYIFSVSEKKDRYSLHVPNIWLWFSAIFLVIGAILKITFMYSEGCRYLKILYPWVISLSTLIHQAVYENYVIKMQCAASFDNYISPLRDSAYVYTWCASIWKSNGI